MPSRWMIRLRALVRGHRVDAEFDEELRYHLDQQVRRYVERGMSPDEARKRALREFGNPLLLREEARETWRWRRLDELARDVRHSARALRSTPGFTAVAVLSLGVGIGASTSLFSVIDAVDFRPLPFHQPERLVWLSEVLPETDPVCPRCALLTSVPTAADWRTRSRFYAAFGLQGHRGRCLVNGGLSHCPDVGRASPGFFDVLGVPPALGREFVPEDTVAGAEPVVLLDHETWVRRFDADPAALGARFEYFEDSTLDVPVEATVVGVLPDGFRFWRDFPFWIPLTADPGGRARRSTTAVARLRPGIDPAAAEAELHAVQTGLAAEYPEVYRGRGSAVRPLRERLGWRAGEGRGALFTVTVIVLAVAVLNVAGLFTARAAGRRQELTVRRALGASRGRLVRRLLVEGVVLGLAGGVLGMAMASWGVRAANLSFDLERYGPEAVVDHRVLAFGAGLSIVVGVLAALLPAAGVGRTDLYTVLRDPVSPGPGSHRGWTRGALLAGQIAAGLVLLTGAGLLGSEYANLRYLDLGYDPQHVYEASVPGPVEYREQPELLRPEAERARTRIEAVTGVASASLRHHSARGPSIVRPEGRVGSAPEDEYIAVDAVDADYFETLGIPILAGRPLTPADGAGAPAVVVVNRSAASRFWPGRSAPGRRIFLGDSASVGRWATVVGVVEDVEQAELVRRHNPRVYRPLPQSPIYHPFIQIHLRLARGSPGVLAAVQGTLREALGRPIRALTSHEAELAERFRSQRISALALNLFGAFGLLLASMGLYASVAWSVTRRTREVGVRMALGAGRRRVLALFARESLVAGVAGGVLGCGGSLLLIRILQPLVSVTGVANPRVVAAAALLMASAVVLATYLPARRAAAVDPNVALRGG